MRDRKIELREEVLGLRGFDIPESIAWELTPRIHDDQVVRMEPPAYIVDAYGDERIGIREIVERLAAAADENGISLVEIAKGGECSHASPRRLNSSSRDTLEPCRSICPGLEPRGI